LEPPGPAHATSEAFFPNSPAVVGKSPDGRGTRDVLRWRGSGEPRAFFARGE